MNQLFNAGRAWLLFRKYFGENKKAYALLFLACGASLTLLMGVNLSFTNAYLFEETAQVMYYFAGMIGWGCLSGSLLFSDLGSKSKAINYLLLPASSLEKLVCTVLFGIVIYFIGYTLIFYAVDFTMVSLANEKFKTAWPVINVFTINLYKSKFFEDGQTSYFFYIHFGLQAFFLVGSIYFPKYAFFKTAIALVLIWVFAILYLVIYMKNVVTPGLYHDGVLEAFDPSGRNKIVRLPGGLEGTVEFFFKYAVAVWFWVVAYYRLKEKEV
ncbi:MAG TPA: hypothetical protein VK517_05905 [Cyclobacteriaceae bacterium]|nr:hypothetical protein [Cyclobacteriaceae bacterium]